MKKPSVKKGDPDIPPQSETNHGISMRTAMFSPSGTYQKDAPS